ncbi:ABC transporter ATP-binding protein [Paenibacillus endoradicis]|uniref:ABC transporter ATP-binding protein n=1 Tax=Paenibacillus endoradicis TaxID=2972487 RepID=UPI0021593F6E|nr:ABC transporter ATP-binding protein [Paenibacillus endoradicis]MCR8656372.1 ABC transporter ATP-binding protein [Paenibacillus endoradicis]
MIRAQSLSYNYDEINIFRDLNFAFEMNRFYGIIGPNGAGKSTFLQLLAGIRKPTTGSVLFQEQPIHHFPRKIIAQKIAVLQQGGLPPLGFSVREVIEMGRFPYQSWLGGEKANIDGIIEEAIQLTGLTNLVHRKLDQLSGGERQRVALAKLIVQQPEIILLDEPTTYLDIGYQQIIMDVVKSWQQQKQLLVIAVMHDLNVSALYCDQLLALHNGQIIASGTPEQVLTTDRMKEMYNASTVIIEHPVNQSPQLLLSQTKGE